MLALVAACGLVAGCSPGDDRTLAIPESSEPAPPPESTRPATTTVAPLPPPTQPPAAPTSVRANPTSTSTTTTSPELPDEPARARPASTLSRPDGFARHEPAEEWAGEAALTGLAIEPDIAARPSLAVKIDNAPGGRPPWNLADADLVIEENVEGVTRFVAVYHSQQPDRIGPVRSARTGDIDILAGLNRPILAWSGGNRVVTGDVRGAHKYGWLSNLSALQTDCFWRSSQRPAPHNLMLDPACAWASTTYAGPARPLFARDDGGRPPGPDEARFDVRMSGVDVTWVWDDDTGQYLRRQNGDWHRDVDGAQIAAVNVVVLSVDYVRSDADPRSPEAVTVGSGLAVVHRGGVALVGRWERADRFEPFRLVADDGSAILLAPGTVFVELPRA